MSDKTFRASLGRGQNVPVPTADFEAALQELGIPETQDDLLRGIWFTNKAILAELRTLRTHLEIINNEELEVCDAD